VKGFYRVIAQYGYRVSKVSMKRIIDRINIILPELEINIDDTSFFLGSEHARGDKNRWFGHRWRIRFFNMMLQICHSASGTFKVPTTKLVFLGSEKRM
jgi:K+ transporter